jgi:uncharacterized protein (TIGR00645 family)
MSDKKVTSSDASAQETSRTGIHPLERLEGGVETLLFASRWILAPLYLGLAASLACLSYKFIETFIQMMQTIKSSDLHAITLQVLELLDITLLGNLMLIMIFSGYENFVSKIGAAEQSEDRPSWMGKVDYSGLKIKLIGSLVAISVIELLKDFMETEHLNPELERWRVAIHLTFVFSGVLFAVMDYIADKRHSIELDAEVKHLEIAKLAAEFEQFKKSLAAE